MKRWLRRLVIAAGLVAVVGGVYFETETRVGRAGCTGEPFYDGRPVVLGERNRALGNPKCGLVQKYAPADLAFVKRANAPRRTLVAPAGRRPGRPGCAESAGEHASSEVQDQRGSASSESTTTMRSHKFKHPSVVMTAQLYEVDEAFYKEIAKLNASMPNLENLDAFDGWARRKADGKSLFDLLEEQKPLGREGNQDRSGQGRECYCRQPRKSTACRARLICARAGKARKRSRRAWRLAHKRKSVLTGDSCA